MAVLALALGCMAVSGPVDDYHYDYATHCAKRPTPGANALVRWLQRNSRGEFWGIMRCEKLPTSGRTGNRRDYSLHSEGRAVDWHLDAWRPRDRRAASKLIRRLLATDSQGNEHALARRMGIQEIIWNCHSWWAGPQGMQPYSLCYDRHGHRKRNVDPTLAHRNHVHLGLSRAGARKRTSFWR